MTLKSVRPATMNSTRLSALILFGVGIAIFAYLLALRGAPLRPPVASTIAWTGGFALLVLDESKRRGEHNHDGIRSSDLAWSILRMKASPPAPSTRSEQAPAAMGMRVPLTHCGSARGDRTQSNE
jgi:hypothetical protein